MGAVGVVNRDGHVRVAVIDAFPQVQVEVFVFVCQTAMLRRVLPVDDRGQISIAVAVQRDLVGCDDRSFFQTWTGTGSVALTCEFKPNTANDNNFA